MLSKKIKRGEVDLYSDAVDRSLIHTGSVLEIKKQRKLLKTNPDVYLCEKDEFFNKSIKIETSKFSKLKLDFYPVPKHLISKLKKQNPKVKIKKIKAQPTMSYRTLWLSFKKFHCFAKFDYPFKLGGAKRVMSLSEGAYSLFVSDSLRANWRHAKTLQPIWDECFLYSEKLKNYRVLLRADDYLYKSQFILPLASFIKAQIQKQKNLTSIEIYKNTIEKVLITYMDLALKLYKEGISLESHGQNLLVECKDEKTLKFTGKFYYRDFSVVALCRQIREKAKILSPIEKSKIFVLSQTTEEFLDDVFWKKLYIDLPSTFLYPFVAYRAKDQSNQEIYSEYLKLLKQKLKTTPKFYSSLT